MLPTARQLDPEPLSVWTSTSTVGFPRESRISRAMTPVISDILELLPVGGDRRPTAAAVPCQGPPKRLTDNTRRGIQRHVWSRPNTRSSVSPARTPWDESLIHVEASPPGAIVEVSWSPAGAHAFADYDGWGQGELNVLRRAIDEASSLHARAPREARALPARATARCQPAQATAALKRWSG